MARTDSGAVPKRPHHISSIAHLFLEESRDDPVGDPVPDICHCTVAAPGGAAISAFAAAGLTLGSPGFSTLEEDSLIRWSAGTFFNHEVARSRVFAGAAEDHRNKWTIAAETRGQNSGAPGGTSPAPKVHWNHLGCVGRVELAYLESLTAGRSAGLLAGIRTGGLVWCLQEDEAGRLGPNYFLGRLAELVKPSRIEILLFPNAWSSAGQPGWLEEISNVAAVRHDSEHLTRIVGLADKSCDGIPVGIHQVAGEDNLAVNFSRSGDSDSLWGRVAGAMIAGLAKC